MSKFKAGIGFTGRYQLGTGFIGAYPSLALGALIARTTGMTAYDSDLDQLMVVDNAGMWVPLATNVTWARTFIVSAVGGTQTTIADAITAANALVPPPSVANPANIIVQTGTYAEANPLTIPSGVNIIAATGPDGTVVTPNTITAPIFILNSNSSIIGFTLNGASGIGGVGIRAFNGASPVYIFNTVFIDCMVGIDTYGASTKVFVSNIYMRKTNDIPLNYGIYVHDSGYLEGEGVYITGDPLDTTPWDRAIFTDTINTGCLLNDLIVTHPDYGISVDNGASLRITSGRIFNANHGVHIGANGTGSTLHIDTLAITNSITDDVLIENDNSHFRTHESTFRRDLFNYPAPTANSDWVGIYANEEPTNIGTQTLGTFTLGDVVEGYLGLYSRATDPGDPENDASKFWLSDGTGVGLNGDFLAKITDGSGTTRTATILEYNTPTCEVPFEPDHLDGLQIVWQNTEDTQIQIGTCRSYGDTRNLRSTSPVVVALDASGAGGLDVGIEAADTWYYVYLIYDPTTGTYAGLFSLNMTTPTLPGTYQYYRRVGVVYNDSGSNIRQFVEVGDGRTKDYLWDEELANLEVLTDGVATTHTGLDLGANGWVSPTSVKARILVRNKTLDPQVYVQFRPEILSNIEAIAIVGPETNGGMSYDDINLPVEPTNVDIEYAFSADPGANGLDVWSTGFTDEV